MSQLELFNSEGYKITEKVKKIIKLTDYYVYALVDPRDNEFFYVGKGRGKRIENQLSKNNKKYRLDLSRQLYDIRREGFEPIGKIILNYLDEETAYLVEKLLVFRIGRKCFGEGRLVNRLKGGDIDSLSSRFYFKPIDENAILNKLNDEQLKKIEVYKKISEIKYISELDSDRKVFCYSRGGDIYSIDSIKCFFNRRGIIPEVASKLLYSKLPFITHKTIISSEPIKYFKLNKIFNELHGGFYDEVFFINLLRSIYCNDRKQIKLMVNNRLKMIAKNNDSFLMVACEVGIGYEVRQYVTILNDIFHSHNHCIILNKQIFRNEEMFNSFFNKALEVYKTALLNC
jgi:hypothetical protein